MRLDAAAPSPGPAKKGAQNQGCPIQIPSRFHSGFPGGMRLNPYANIRVLCAQAQCSIFPRLPSDPEGLFPAVKPRVASCGRLLIRPCQYSAFKKRRIPLFRSQILHRKFTFVHFRFWILQSECVIISCVRLTMYSISFVSFFCRRRSAAFGGVRQKCNFSEGSARQHGV